MNKTTYYLSLENMVPNAFVELKKRNLRTENIPLIIIEKYGLEVAKKLRQDGNKVIFGLSRNNTQHFSVNYSKYFTINDLPEDKPTTISLNKEITLEDLINHFIGYQPLELLVAFQNKEVVQIGLLDNISLKKEQINSKKKIKKLNH